MQLNFSSPPKGRSVRTISSTNTDPRSEKRYKIAAADFKSFDSRLDFRCDDSVENIDFIWSEENSAWGDRSAIRAKSEEEERNAPRVDGGIEAQGNEMERGLDRRVSRDRRSAEKRVYFLLGLWFRFCVAGTLETLATRQFGELEESIFNNIYTHKYLL